MLRKTIAVLVVLAAACGGNGSGPSTFGTLPPTTPPTQTLATATTLPPPPPDVAEMLIPITAMPAGWIQIDDMSGPVGLADFEASLLDGLGPVAIVNAARVTFARSATSELSSLSRGGAELLVSLALELEDADSAMASLDTLERQLSGLTVGRRSISRPGPGVRLELTGGIFLIAWSTDVIVQMIVANGVPGSNIDNIVPLVPEVER